MEDALLLKKAKRALDSGDFLAAHELASAGWPQCQTEEERDELRHVSTIALLEMGWFDRAREALDELECKRDASVEGMCRVGRLHRDLALEESDMPKRANSLERALAVYRRAFDISHDFYPGVNAAFVSVLLGEMALAERIASAVVAHCEVRVTGPSSADFWAWASLGEAWAILGNETAARRAYSSARPLARGRVRDLITTIKRARMVGASRFDAPGLFDDVLRLPSLVVFSGHMLNHPDCPTGRLAPARSAEVGRVIAQRLDDLDAELGFASAACGADILFLESMLARGSSVHVVLPWSEEQFIRTSVAFADGGAWVPRFREVLSKATTVRVLAQEGMPEGPAGRVFSAKVLVGLGMMMAQRLGLGVRPLVVWDGAPGSPGGTGDFVGCWQSLGLDVSVIPCPPGGRVEPDENSLKDGANAVLRHEVKTLLFADIVGYSRLTESQIAAFVTTVLKQISLMIAGSGHTPTFVNTWGDALYMVFDGAPRGARFALELVGWFERFDGTAVGLPSDLNVRVALHAGPVLVGPDPVMHTISFNGSHVSRAARIEPVVEPGQIFVSEEFAALATLETPQDFRFESLGGVALAKNWGTCRLFRLVPVRLRSVPGGPLER